MSKGLAVLPFGGRLRAFFLAPGFFAPALPPVPSDAPDSSTARLPFPVRAEPMQPTLLSFLPTAPRNWSNAALNDSKITRFTAQDYEVYAAGFRRFAEAAGVVEAATGTQVLCARDIQPATRSALGATAAGRRLVAALDAGALPQPTPGLLPRREDGVDPVPCSFH